MSRSIFGWSYPPGCSGPPDYPDEADAVQPQCSCGAYLSWKPHRTERVDIMANCPGFTEEDAEFMWESECGNNKPHEPHKFLYEYRTVLIWDCKRCKKEYRYTG